jgi:Family of unknown function (DUF5670)
MSQPIFFGARAFQYYKMELPLHRLPDGTREVLTVLSDHLEGPRWPPDIQLRRPEMDLLWTIAVILAILWLLGLVTSYTLGGFIHILLVLAIIVVLIRVIQGRRPV